MRQNVGVKRGKHLQCGIEVAGIAKVQERQRRLARRRCVLCLCTHTARPCSSTSLHSRPRTHGMLPAASFLGRATLLALGAHHPMRIYANASAYPSSQAIQTTCLLWRSPPIGENEKLADFGPHTPLGMLTFGQITGPPGFGMVSSCVEAELHA